MERTTVDELLRRLADLSPMPDDDHPSLTVGRLQSYNEVLERVHTYLRHRQGETSRDQLLIRALINSFGYGDAHESYWATVHALERYPTDQLRVPLHDALRTGAAGARMWSALMLGRQRNPSDLPLLVSALQDSAPRVRYNALGAIAIMGDSSAVAAIEALRSDPDEAVRKNAQETASKLSRGRHTGRT